MEDVAETGRQVESQVHIKTLELKANADSVHPREPGGSALCDAQILLHCLLRHQRHSSVRASVPAEATVLVRWFSSSSAA